MRIGVGDKVILIPDGKGGYIAQKPGQVGIGDKCLLIPDSHGNYQLAKLSTPGIGDKLITIPTDINENIAWKGGYNYKALAAYGSQLYYTEDTGKTWTATYTLPISTGVDMSDADPMVPSQVEYLEVGKMLASGYYSGLNAVLRANEYGRIWAASKFSEEGGGIRFGYLGSGRVALCWYDWPYNCMSISTDYGWHWTLKACFETHPAFPDYPGHIATDGAGNVIVLFNNNASFTNNILISHDNGETWAGSGIPYEGAAVGQKGAAYCGENTIIVSAVHPILGGRIYKSTNNGDTFSAIDAPVDTAGCVCSPEEGCIVITGCRFHNGRHMISEDYGSNWIIGDSDQGWYSDFKASRVFNCIAGVHPTTMAGYRGSNSGDKHWGVIENNGNATPLYTFSFVED